MHPFDEATQKLDAPCAMKSDKRRYYCRHCGVAIKLAEQPENWWPKCPACRRLMVCMICNNPSGFSHNHYCYTLAM